jgi:5-methylcytosine-specific restriction endonuclease McrBC regulatory subunit McrC
MVQYKPLLPWVRLVLTNQSPIFSEGKWEGISLLFPMEQVFEEYVTEILKRGKLTDTMNSCTKRVKPLAAILSLRMSPVCAP